MKKNSTPPTLEELLASVEHAGRDARRQQQLSDMIEQMAAQEAASRRRKVRLWTTRIAVAATVTFFVTTAVWQWLTPGVPTLRQASLKPVAPQEAHPIVNNVPALPTAPVAKRRQLPAAQPDSPLSPLPEPVMQDVIDALDEYMPDVMSESALPQEELYAETLPEEAAPVASHDTTAYPVTQSEQLAQAPADSQPSSRHRSIFSLRLAEPSKMDGTVLALQIF